MTIEGRWLNEKEIAGFSSDVLRATGCTYKRGTGGLNYLDYLPPLEHGRPSTGPRFPGRRQIAAYRAGTGILILPRTRPGNSWRAFPARSYRKRRETTSGIAHTTAAVVPPKKWKKWSVVPARARFAARVSPLLPNPPAPRPRNLIFTASRFPRHRWPL